MKYILVANKQTVVLGPIHWRPRQFQQELNDLEVAFLVPIIEQGYVYINNVYEIFPIVATISPNIDGEYEEPVGPMYTYLNNEATETYTKQDRNLDVIKDNIKEKATLKRYLKEIGGFEITVKGFVVFIDTARDFRTMLELKLSRMQAGDLLKWKFRRRWIELTKAEVTWLVNQINNHIDDQFTWENTVHTNLDNAVDIAAIQAIVVAEELDSRN